MTLSKKCIVKGCSNHEHQGQFVGYLCKPCYMYLSTGNIGPTDSFLNLHTRISQILANTKNSPEEQFAFYESGLIAHGCLENLDEYMLESIQRYGRILLKQIYENHYQT